jgi:hypothetical protein
VRVFAAPAATVSSLLCTALHQQLPFTITQHGHHQHAHWFKAVPAAQALGASGNKNAL